MNFSQILDAASFSGGRRQFVLSSNNERLVLPVTPWKYQVTTAQDNKTVDILDTGEALIFGNPKLKRLKFSCFFPALRHKYPFVVGAELETSECIALLEKWKTSKQPVRVIITDSSINLQMAVMDFNYSEKDGSRDVDYTLNLTEYRELNVAQSNNTKIIDDTTGLRNRPAAERTAAQIGFQVEKGAVDVLEASKIAYGNFGSLSTFLSKNNIENMINFSPQLTSAGWKF